MPAADSSRWTDSAAVEGAGNARDSAGHYLRTLFGGSAVLDHEILGEDEVRELCRRVQAGYYEATVDAADRDVATGGGGPPRIEETGPADGSGSAGADVLSRIGMISDRGAIEALWKVVGHNLRLVRWVGDSFSVPAHGRLSRDDLYSSALIGLIRSILRYDPQKKFSTYAICCMKAEVKDAFRRHCSAAHIPKNAQAGRTRADPELINNAKKATLELDLSGGCGPHLEDHAPEYRLAEGLRSADEGADTEEEALAAIEEDSVGQAYSMIGEHERELLALHLGLPDSPLADSGELRVRDIMRHTGLSHQAIRHRLDVAMRQIRDRMEEIDSSAVPVICGPAPGESLSGGPSASEPLDTGEPAGAGAGRLVGRAPANPRLPRVGVLADAASATGPRPYCLRCGYEKGEYNRNSGLCTSCRNLYNVVYGKVRGEWERIQADLQELRRQPGCGDLRSAKESAAAKLPLYPLNCLALSKSVVEASALIECYPYVGEYLAGLDDDQCVYLGSERLLASAWPGAERSLSRALRNLSAAGSITVLSRPHGIGSNAPPDVYLVNEAYAQPVIGRSGGGRDSAPAAALAGRRIAATDPSSPTRKGVTRAKEMH